MADLKNLMEAAQKMQEGIKAAQEKMRSNCVDVTFGANAVKIKMRGDYMIEHLEIDASARQHPDLHKMLLGAFNEAVEKVTKNQKDQILELAKDIDIDSIKDGGE